MSRKAKQMISDIFTKSGVQINGSNPWDIKIHDEGFYDRVLAQGSLGLGESYMDGWWDSDSIDEMMLRLIRAKLDEHYPLNFSSVTGYLTACVLNLQSKKRATIVGEQHYDTGNDLFSHMLDKRMAYSCGYWKNARTLDEAQEGKLDLICRKIDLQPGMRVLDIGCGWGSFAQFAAEKYGAEVVGITISKEQLELAKKRCAGLPVDLRFQDYRDVTEKFDRIVSVGQFEHVGSKNYRTYFKVSRRCLKNDGLFLLHTIGGNRTVRNGDPWLEKYIFPGGMLPSIKQIGGAIERNYVMEDWHNFSTDYDKTLLAWHANFNNSWDKLKSSYGERFYRMWNYYLLLCAACFRSRRIQLWQTVLSPEGVPGGYESIR